MKVLVTGSTGFVGSHLCEQLTKDGHEVFAQARNQTKFHHFKVPGKLIEGDFSADCPHGWVEQLPSDLDAIIHTVGVVHSFNPQAFFDSNALALQQFIKDLSHKYRENRLRIILISSLAAAGPSNPDHPLTESSPARPINNYGQSKLDAEQILLDTIPSNWTSLIIRPPMVIGPRDPAILDIFKMVKSRAILYPGFDGLDNRYSFVSVFDLVKLCAQGLRAESNKEVFFASFPQNITYNEIIEEVAKLLQLKYILKLPIPRLLMRPAAFIVFMLNKLFSINARLTPDKAYEIVEQSWTCCSRKSVEKLNHQYVVGFQEILTKTFEDYKSRQWL